MLSQVQQWVWANQWIVPVILWCVAGLIYELFKPRSAEQYDKMNPRVAAFLVWLGSISNPSKMLEYAKRVITGWATPAATTTLVALCTFVAGSALVACSSAHASPADFGITPRSLLHKKETDTCLATAAAEVQAKVPGVCARYNACMRLAADKAGVKDTGRCVETTPAGAASAGVPVSVLPVIVEASRVTLR